MERLGKHIRSHIFGEYMKEKELQTPNGILLNENFLKIETVGAKNQHIFYKNYVDNGKISEKEIEKLTLHQEETDESD